MEKRAVALKYDNDDSAPKIIAKGSEKIAQLIIKIAKENNIFIKEDLYLSQALMDYNVGEYIPEELYDIIAKILAFIYKFKLD